MKKIIFALCLFTIFACGSDDDSSDEVMEDPCPTEIQYAFRITVRDASDNSLLEEVSIRAIDQMFEEMFITESPGVYVGLEERPGTYQLIIERENFQTIILSESSIEMDECGLVTQTLSVVLEPM